MKATWTPLLLLAAIVPSPARAHDFTPGVLSIVEEEPGVYRYAFSPPVDDGVSTDITVSFPPSCRADAGQLRCPGGLAGEVHFSRGVDRRVQIVVLFERRDGRRSEVLLAGAEPRWRVDASDGGARGWLALGIEHVLRGYDHLAFLLGLLLVIGVGQRRDEERARGAVAYRAAGAITAFTLAHSLTLALATLGLVTLPTAPVEAAIALSVLLLAWESTHERPTLSRRWPWLVALTFGLVHGLGFAAALGAVGLPPRPLVAALLFFNVGVELAQLGVVALVLLLSWAVRGRDLCVPVRAIASYGLGAAGAYWLLVRCLALGG